MQFSISEFAPSGLDMPPKHESSEFTGAGTVMYIRLEELGTELVVWKT